MKKENRPGQQAANIDIRGSDVTPPAPTTQAPRRTPKKHRARVYMLRTGVTLIVALFTATNLAYG
ncbi:hypothetical protein GPH17_19060 [Escherichia coli]|nr:hypothetical protein [Escherichia coli]EIW6487774.1 hypothetical protein [Escherichia coli]EJJ1098812.1 hypothetical protein [Escherichia coli]